VNVVFPRPDNLGASLPDESWDIERAALTSEHDELFGSAGTLWSLQSLVFGPIAGCLLPVD